MTSDNGARGTFGNFADHQYTGMFGQTELANPKKRLLGGGYFSSGRSNGKDPDAYRDLGD